LIDFRKKYKEKERPDFEPAVLYIDHIAL